MNCYVLIGGLSTRMGQSKPELFLKRVVAAAQPVFDEVIAVQRPGGPAASIETIFETPHRDEGPIFGIARALLHAGGRRCAVVAVDYPLVTRELLQYLVKASAGAMMTVPVWGGRPQPLCGIYDPAILPLIRSRLAAGKRDVIGLIDEVPAKMIDEQTLRARFEGQPLLNVNTPAELEEAEALYGK